MKWMVVAALMLAPMTAVAYSTPMVEDDAGPVWRCEIDGAVVFRRSECPEGGVVRGWNVPVVQSPEEGEGQRLSGEPSISAEERAARARISELARQANERREQRQQLPRLDVESRCRAVASVGGGYSASIFNGCMQQEQAAYNGLSALFSASPAGIRERCIQVATVGEGGSYSILQGCLKRERSAASSAPGFRY